MERPHCIERPLPPAATTLTGSGYRQARRVPAAPLPPAAPPRCRRRPPCSPRPSAPLPPAALLAAAAGRSARRYS